MLGSASVRVLQPVKLPRHPREALCASTEDPRTRETSRKSVTSSEDVLPFTCMQSPCSGRHGRLVSVCVSALSGYPPLAIRALRVDGQFARWRWRAMSGMTSQHSILIAPMERHELFQIGILRQKHYCLFNMLVFVLQRNELRFLMVRGGTEHRLRGAPRLWCPRVTCVFAATSRSRSLPRNT